MFFMLKSYGWWWVGGVSPRPLGFGFLDLGLWGLGPGLDNMKGILVRDLACPDKAEPI